MSNCLVGSGFPERGGNVSFVYQTVWVPSWTLDRQMSRGQAVLTGFLNYSTVLSNDIAKYPANSHIQIQMTARAPKLKFLHSFKSHYLGYNLGKADFKNVGDRWLE